jgi:predicted dehydrogenase
VRLEQMSKGAFRVNAGSLPASHWYRDRRQGGRLLGEVCHFIDTCMALVDAPVTSVFTAGSGRGETLLQDDTVVVLRFDDGSLATISYASAGNRKTGKERLEVIGRGHTAVVDDYRTIELDGTTRRLPSQDKGHVAELRTFLAAVRGEAHPESLTGSALASMTATLAAAESLLTGLPVTPELP